MSQKLYLVGEIKRDDCGHRVVEDRINMPLDEAFAFLVTKYLSKGQKVPALMAAFAADWCATVEEIERGIKKKR